MENNQNRQPTSDTEKKGNRAEGENGGRRNRHWHKHNRKHKGEGDGKQNAQAPSIDKNFFAPAEKAPAETQEKSAPQPNQEHKKNNHNHNRNQKHKNNRDNAHKSNAQNRQGNNSRRGNEQRPYDPYEEVRPEELSLEELRARIVIKPTEQASEAPAPTPEEPALAEEMLLQDEPVKDFPAEEEEKVEVIGVRFRSSRKTYYFDPQGIRAKKGEYAIVETARGAEFGEISLANTMVNVKSTVSPLRPILRIATPEDIQHDADNREKEKEALGICQERIEAHKLPMKLIDVQYAFDNSKLLFYFTADGRVDFRELVKDLASIFRTRRVELRQIGIRDEAKILGGLGACGRPFCCATFLPDFAQVSIKMAKDQNLSLNSAKISGLCGRLMCCLRYESEVYAEEIKLTPQPDTVVKTEDGIGTVISTSPLAGTVRVVLKDSPDTPPKQYHRSTVTVIGKANRENNEKKEDSSNKKA